MVSVQAGFDAPLPAHTEGKASRQSQDQTPAVESVRQDSKSSTSDSVRSQHGIIKAGKVKRWSMVTMEVLKDLVAEARGAASKPVMDYIQKHSAGTKVIFVVGQSGTGKTSLLKELTGIDLNEGKGVKSGTLYYHLCPAIIQDEKYIFVDTAGFGAFDIDNENNLSNIVGCLNVLGHFLEIAGLLFVYGGDQARITSEDLRTIQWVQCFCGPEFYRNVVFVTTKWDVPKKKPFEAAWHRVEDLLRTPEVAALCDPPTRHLGASVYHHGFPGGVGNIAAYESVLCKDEESEERTRELESLIVRTFESAPVTKLQAVREMGPKGNWHTTEAAKVLKHEPRAITIEIQDNRAVVCPKAVPQPNAAPGSSDSFTTDGSTSNQAGESKVTSSSTTTPSASETSENAPRDEEQSWSKNIWGWLEAAVAVARFFQQAREKAKGKDKKSNSKKETNGMWASAWQAMQGPWRTSV